VPDLQLNLHGRADETRMEYNGVEEFENSLQTSCF